jgi:hypothetical protein
MNRTRFLLRGLRSGSCTIPVNPSFNSCYESDEEVLEISYFLPQFLVHEYKLLFLLAGKEPRQNLYSDIPHVSSSPLQFTDMFYVRSLTFQGSTKYYFVSED